MIDKIWIIKDKYGLEVWEFDDKIEIGDVGKVLEFYVIFVE